MPPEEVTRLLPAPERAADLLRLDDTLAALERTDPRKAQVVELRFFGGLTIEETSDILGLSSATVERDLKLARAWLRKEMAV